MRCHTCTVYTHTHTVESRVVFEQNLQLKQPPTRKWMNPLAGFAGCAKQCNSLIDLRPRSFKLCHQLLLFCCWHLPPLFIKPRLAEDEDSSGCPQIQRGPVCHLIARRRDCQWQILWRASIIRSLRLTGGQMPSICRASLNL